MKRPSLQSRNNLGESNIPACVPIISSITQYFAPNRTDNGGLLGNAIQHKKTR